MKFIIGTKQNMTQFFDDTGEVFPATIVNAGPVTVVYKKTKEKDGYEAVQLGFGEQKENRISKPVKGHMKDFGNFKLLKEFRVDASALAEGDKIDASVFTIGDTVSVSGISKGKGFQGVVKRHGFAGVGGQTHGQHNRQRHPGSIGACSWPSRVFKGMRMAGRMGGDRVTVANLRVLKVYAEQNLILVSGSVPGPKNSFVILEK